MNVLEQLVCSRVRAGILGALFGTRVEALHLREIQRRVGLSVGTVQQDLEKLARLGLVTRRRDGNRVYFEANDKHPLCPDLRQLVLKTVGLTDVMRAALVRERVQCAFVFGSVAAGAAGAESDIDLMVIGDIGLRRLATALSGLGQRLGREINPHVMTPSAFAKRAREKEHLVTAILAGPKIFVVGTEHELEAMRTDGDRHVVVPL